jgi:hypothetical protein
LVGIFFRSDDGAAPLGHFLWVKAEIFEGNIRAQPADLGGKRKFFQKR